MRVRRKQRLRGAVRSDAASDAIAAARRTLLALSARFFMALYDTHTHSLRIVYTLPLMGTPI